ncbi:MAG: hypothetical protein WCB51_09225, partial [Candidatus Dormiibacterota bacterium]
MASPLTSSGSSLWESEGGITSLRTHAVAWRSRPVRVACTVLGTTAIAGATLHPVNAQAPKLQVAASCPVAVSPMNFAFTGGEQCFTVPAGVREIEAGLFGGFGGTGYNPASPSPLGGNGAIVISNITVTPGQILYVEVGGPGYPGGSPDAIASAGSGGGNGGGNGGTSRLATGQPRAGGGGGATD